MTTIDTSREAVEALMEGVTDGDWSYIGEEDNDFVVFAGGEAFLANVAGGRLTPLYAPDERGVVAFDIEHQANAGFIAAARQLVPALLDRAERAEAELATLKAERERLRKELGAAQGYLVNAKIDLETGATKATAIRTIEGGYRRIRAALGDAS